MFDPKVAKTGDIILVEGKGPLGKIINFAEVNPFSHSAIVSKNGKIVEALWHVTENPLEKYQENGWLYSILGADDKNSEIAVEYANSLIGLSYDKLLLIEEGLKYFGHIPIHKKLSKKTIICSVIPFLAWRRGGIILSYEPAPSPASLSYSPFLLGKRPWDKYY